MTRITQKERIYNLLKENGRPMTPMEINTQLGIKKGNFASFIKPLLQDGLIIRTYHKIDKRSYTISIAKPKPYYIPITCEKSGNEIIYTLKDPNKIPNRPKVNCRCEYCIYTDEKGRKRGRDIYVDKVWLLQQIDNYTDADSIPKQTRKFVVRILREEEPKIVNIITKKVLALLEEVNDKRIENDNVIQKEHISDKKSALSNKKINKKSNEVK